MDIYLKQGASDKPPFKGHRFCHFAWLPGEILVITYGSFRKAA